MSFSVIVVSFLGYPKGLVLFSSFSLYLLLYEQTKEETRKQDKESGFLLQWCVIGGWRVGVWDMDVFVYIV